MQDSITGKVVVITGASSGLGETTARHLSARGAHLVLGARRLDRLRALADELAAAGGKAVVRETDVTKRGDVEALVAAGLEAFGRIDVIINNAGIMPLSTLDRLKVDDWDRMIDINIRGVLYGIAAVLPIMKEQKSGHIINISSVAAVKVRPGSAVYAATKEAVRIISEGLRQEVKPYNIRSTIISPGMVSTELPKSITEQDVSERLHANYKAAISPEAVARAIAFVINEPDDVDVNEILIRPTVQEV